MTDLELDIKSACKIVKSPYSLVYEEMTDYSRLYQNTSENIKAYMPYLETMKGKALLPTSSGDHQLEAILAGLTEITCYDINRLAKYFTELKFTAMKSLTKKEFIHYMYKDFLDKDYFRYLKGNLDEDTRCFWEELFKKYNNERIANNLFRYLGIKKNEKYIRGVNFSRYCAENFTSYLDGGNYKLVQGRLEKAKITYLDGDILDLTPSLEDSYALINLTNVYEFINKKIDKSKSKEFAITVKGLIKHLNEDGKILISYLYRCDLTDIKKFWNTSQSYILFLAFLENQPLIKCLQDCLASENDSKTILDKLYTIRNVQSLKYLKDLDIEKIELPPAGLGYWKGNKDMALIYTKKRS